MTSLRRVARLAPVLALAVAATLTTTVGSPAQAAPAPTSAGDLGPTSYSALGPYGVGERTMKLKSGVKVELWYPATPADVSGLPEDSYNVVDWLPANLQALLPEGAEVSYPSGGVRGVPAAQKKFPLVVFSHGYAGFRTQSSALTSAIASWGFVVAAPDHPSRNLTKVLFGPPATTTDIQDLQDTITLMGKTSAAKRSWLHNRVDMTHVALLGHSAGGSAVEKVAVIDKRVDTFIGMAGASVGALDEEAPKVPKKPGLLLAATADGVVPLDKMEAAYAALKKPKRIVLIGDAGHLVFSDLCEVGAADGGLLAVAALLNFPVPPSLIPLATDGCIAPALPPTEAWPAIQHTIVAYLRNVFGIDKSEAALTGLAEAYPGIVTDSRSAQ